MQRTQGRRVQVVMTMEPQKRGGAQKVRVGHVDDGRDLVPVVTVQYCGR